MFFSINYLRVAIATVLILLTSACSKDEKYDNQLSSDDPLSGYVLLGEESTANASVRLYASEEAYVGYNKMALQVFKPGTNNQLRAISVQLLPIMDMGMMKHSAPLENPVYNEALTAFSGSCTFIMPSGQMGSWTLAVLLDNEGVLDTLTFPINVIPKSETKLISFESEIDSSKLFVALRAPKDPEIGANSFELMVYKMENLMFFPAVENLNIEIIPEMPTMGHGSPNNVNPVHQQNGHYVGEVNFTMSGYWKVNLVVKNDEGQMIKSDGYFEIIFQ